MAVDVTLSCNRIVRLPITRGLKANRSEKGLWLPEVAMMSLPQTKLERQCHGKVLSEAMVSRDLSFVVSRQIHFISSICLCMHSLPHR